MDYHLLTRIPAGNPHRPSLPGNLEAAKEYANKHYPDASALMLFEGGGTEILGGQLIAVFTPERGWTEVIGDPLEWWGRLRPEAREVVAKDPFTPFLGETLEALIEAQAPVAAAYWIGVDDERIDGFKLQFDDAVFVTVASRLGVKR